MNLKEIRELLEMIENSSIEKFEMERAGVVIRIKRGSDRIAPTGPEIPETQAIEALDRPDKTVRAIEPPDESLYVFKAPLVGTFYITPKPDAEPFVQAGDSVQKGAVLCIIEAMKLFNQIECDVDGEILRILVENGQPVEYGEPLFQIRLRS